MGDHHGQRQADRTAICGVPHRHILIAGASEFFYHTARHSKEGEPRISETPEAICAFVRLQTPALARGLVNVAGEVLESFLEGGNE